MLNNSYNSKIPQYQLDKFNGLLEKIIDIDNSIPLNTKSIFNFKGRKSEKIAKIVIEHLTNENSKVCDPFLGTGTFAIASSSIPRETTGIELDNYTYSVVNSTISKINYSKLNDLFQTVKKVVFDDIMKLYETKCCGNKNYIKVFYFDPETKEYYSPKPHREIKDLKNIRLLYKCPTCKGQSKRFDSIDEVKISYFNSLDISRFPNHNLIENSRINITASTGANKYDTNFTNRNKYALLLIQGAISQLDDSPERDLLEHALVSSLTLARTAQYGSGSEYIYQVMRFQAQEMNVWYLFESKYQNMISFNKNYFINKHKTLPNDTNYLKLINCDYSEVLSLKQYDEFFDLIYTDPPYTDQVPYLERNQLYRDWLNIFYKSGSFELTDSMLNNEIVVSNSPTRSNIKNTENYYKDLDKMFSHFYKCTTPNGIVALTLNLGKSKYFKTLSEFINMARKNGFEYAFRVDLTKKDPSLRKQSAWRETLSTEMLVFFVKLPTDKIYWYIDNRNIELEISRLIYNLVRDNNGISLSNAVNKVNKQILHLNYGEENIIFNDKIKSLIKDQFIIDRTTANVYIDPDKLYLAIEDNTTLFNKLYDIVPILINNLLNSKGYFTLDDLYFDISRKICSGDINVLNQILDDPQRQSHIMMLINNYCIAESDSFVKKPLNTKVNSDAIDISVLDGYAFEDVLKRLLIAEGYTNVIRQGGAGDRGVDLRAKKFNPISRKVEGYIFQAKRWISDVGGTPIQRLHSIWMQYPNEIAHAVCITTSDYTPQGKNEAISTNVITINGSDLMDKLNHYFPGEYYHSLIDFNS